MLMALEIIMSIINGVFTIADNKNYKWSRVLSEGYRHLNILFHFMTQLCIFGGWESLNLFFPNVMMRHKMFWMRRLHDRKVGYMHDGQLPIS
jgi:hypothetical protein